jgi:hypothetical protein
MAYPLTVVANISTVGNVTYTVPQLLGGFIVRTGTLTANITDTLPNAGPLVEAIQGCMVGTSFEIPIRNATTGAFTMTLNPGTGGTANPTGQTVTQGNTKFYQLVFTNVTIGQEAYTLYSLGGGAT